MHTEQELEEWIIYIDGSLNSEGNGAGLILIRLNGQKIEYVLRL